VAQKTTRLGTPEPTSLTIKPSRSTRRDACQYRKHPPAGKETPYGGNLAVIEA